MISRKSFTDDDVSRIAETIAQLDYKREIRNRDSFNKVFDDYMGDAGVEIRNDNASRTRVFNEFVTQFPDRVTQPEDLKETKEIKEVSRKKIKRDYNYLGKVGSRIVYLRKSFEDREGRKQIVFRDRTGKIGKPKNSKDVNPLSD